MSIGLNSQYRITCAPFATLTSGVNKVSLKNIDIFDSIGEWIHISCAYDSSQRRIDLVAEKNGLEYPAFFFVQDESKAIRKGDVFNVSLFNNIDGLANSAHVAFRELRVWQAYRNSELILANRHSSVPVEENVELNGLRSYYRFASGSKNYRDLAQEYWYGPKDNLSEVFTLESIPGLTVCSSANFYQEGFCYTNPFLSTSIYYTMENVYDEDEDAEMLAYIVSSEASELISQEAEVSRIW